MCEDLECDNNLLHHAPKKSSKRFGPPKPPYETFHTSFQMFQVNDPYYYGQVEDFTDFPGGGDPKYIPQPLGYRSNETQTGSIGDAVGLGNDLLRGLRPAYYKRYIPYDQDVYLNYITTYQNIPLKNSTEIVTLTKLQIHNSSNIDSVINYSVYISTGANQVSITTLAAPGQTATVTLTADLNVYNKTGGFNISIEATTNCIGACISRSNFPVYKGYHEFNFVP